MKTKKWILNNWRAKLISLLLATTLWYLIKKNVATTHSLSDEREGKPTLTEKRYSNAENAQDSLLPSAVPAGNGGTRARAGRIFRCAPGAAHWIPPHPALRSATFRGKARTEETKAGQRADPRGD